jgi:hypothetical protein
MAFAYVFAFRRVNGVDLAVCILKDLAPFGSGSLQNLLRRVTDMEGLAIVAQPVPRRVDIAICQPFRDSLNVFPFHCGQGNLWIHWSPIYADAR